MTDDTTTSIALTEKTAELSDALGWAFKEIEKAELSSVLVGGTASFRVKAAEHCAAAGHSAFQSAQDIYGVSRRCAAAGDYKSANQMTGIISVCADIADRAYLAARNNADAIKGDAENHKQANEHVKDAYRYAGESRHAFDEAKRKCRMDEVSPCDDPETAAADAGPPNALIAETARRAASKANDIGEVVRSLSSSIVPVVGYNDGKFPPPNQPAAA